MSNPLIRAFQTPDGRWHGEPEDPAAYEIQVLMPFFPGSLDPAAGSPYAGQELLLAIGESPTPPGWTRFLLAHGIHYATTVVCWLLFGANEPDEWPWPDHHF